MFPIISFLSYAVVTAITPGPNNIASMSNAARTKFPNFLSLNLGIWTGFSLIMVLCTLFCAALSELLPVMIDPMLFLGAAYMLYLAWKIFRSPAEVTESSRKNGFLSGFLLEFVNPKIMIYGIVSMEVYIFPYFAGRWGMLLLFALLLAFLGFLCTLLWAFCGKLLGTLFSRHGKITNTVMALLLVYCAVSLFL